MLSPEANFAQIEQLLEGLEDSDLILLPETFATGFAVKEQGVEHHAEAASHFYSNVLSVFRLWWLLVY